MSGLADLFSNHSPPPASPKAREALFFSPEPSPLPTPVKHRYAAEVGVSPSVSPSAPVISRHARFEDDGGPSRTGTTLTGGTLAGPSINHFAQGAPDEDDGVLDINLDTVAPRAVAELFDDPLAVQDPLALGGGHEHEPKRKRVVAKIDAERLLGPRGFPALAPQAKRFKVRGKGHESRDLSRLLETYQMWAHTMFPKGDFMFTVGRVETLCRTRRMASGVAGLRDTFYPPSDVPDAERTSDQGEATTGHSGLFGDTESLGAFIAQDEGTFRDDTYRYAPGPETMGQSLFDNPPADAGDTPDEEELQALHDLESDIRMTPRPLPTAVDFGDEPPMFGEEDEW